MIEVPPIEVPPLKAEELVSTSSGPLPDLDKIPDVAQTTPGKDDAAKVLKAEDIKKFEYGEATMAQIESKVQIAKNQGYTWLVVSKNELMMLCHGEYPPTHYIVYKNVKVVCEGCLEEVMAKEKTTAHEKVFPNDKQRMR